MRPAQSDLTGKRLDGLIDQAGVADTIALNPTSEDAWIEVIEKMDQVYADLVHYQLELEEKNAALEEAQQFITSVLASMTDALIVCDADGRVQRANLAAATLIGRKESELRGQPLMSLFAQGSDRTVDQFLEQVRTEGTIVDHEVALIGADGTPAPLAVNCSARYDHDGRLVGAVMIGRPVGELRRAYEELDRAHKALGQAQQQLVFSEKMAALGRLVAGVAHELNNPISFVFGNMYALKRYGERITSYLRAVDSGLDEAALQRQRKEHKIDRILKDITPLVEGTLEGAERISEIVQTCAASRPARKSRWSRQSDPGRPHRDALGGEIGQGQARGGVRHTRPARNHRAQGRGAPDHRQPGAERGRHHRRSARAAH